MKSKITAGPSQLSEELVHDSSEDESNEESSDAEQLAPRPKSKDLPVRETSGARKTKRSKHDHVPTPSSTSGSASSSEDETESEGEKSAASEENENNDPSSDGTPSLESNKRKSLPKSGEQSSAKRTKTKTSTAVQIAPKSFIPPLGFEPYVLSASDYASECNSLFDNLQDKQVWHISAPAAVSIESIKELDIDAAMQGKPILSKDGLDYSMHPSLSSTGILLVPQDKDSAYKQSKSIVSRSFHLRPSSKVSQPKSQERPVAPADISFTAMLEGKQRIPRAQPKGLRMRYTPFGAAPVPRDEDVEMGTETATFQVPDEIVGERSGEMDAANEDGDAMQVDGKHSEKRRAKDKGRDTTEKKKKKKRRLVDEDGS